MLTYFVEANTFKLCVKVNWFLTMYFDSFFLLKSWKTILRFNAIVESKLMIKPGKLQHRLLTNFENWLLVQKKNIFYSYETI